MEEYTLLLQDNKFGYVSKEDYEHLNQFKWYLCNEYIYSFIDNKHWRLHRYIYINLLNENIDNYLIDHIDNNPLNNIRNNLRKVTNSESNRNRKKQDNLSSQYMGVSYRKDKNKWHAQISINNKKIHALYDIEEHAAHQYDLWCKEYNFHTAKLNNINKQDLENFVLYQKKSKKNNLPKNIRLSTNNKFKLAINNKHIGTYNTLLEALITRKFQFKQLEIKKQKEIMDIPIKRNDNNQVIIELYNKNNNKTGETIVDEELYYDLIQYKWNLVKGKYIKNHQLGRLHRYVMNYYGDNVVDHINGNTLDNRKENLRIVTPQQNSMNKKSSKNSSSQYIGVRWNKKSNNWKAVIKINGKQKYLGTFNNEIEAAKARDNATIEYFGEYGNLNLIK